jgi:hypothetical protein
MSMVDQAFLLIRTAFIKASESMPAHNGSYL